MKTAFQWSLAALVALPLNLIPTLVSTPRLASDMGAMAATAPPTQPKVLSSALEAARRGDVAGARARQSLLRDPVEIKLVDWLLADVAYPRLGITELQTLQAELQGWPRQRQLASRLAQQRSRVGPPSAAPSGAQDYAERRREMTRALRRGDAKAAYAVVANHRQSPGTIAYAELESFAGWLALEKLGDPTKAERHFARLDAAVRSPVSKARAAYWRGRAAERAGDPIGALQFYARGAQYKTTFYGQLAAEKAGRTELVLAKDPVASADLHATFESSDLTVALERLSGAGERSLLRVFALHIGDSVKSAEQLALLVDKLKSLGEQETALLAYRRGARHGYILHERGYPVLTPPSVTGGAEQAFVLAITRQESQFDPRARSGADARGLMQLLPSTGRQVALRAGIPWRDGILWEPAANMRLGSRYLGDLAGLFDGSYVLAAAGYNAGPRRPAEWIVFCGDPRSKTASPIDFIECIPFGETRDYVMNVMANYQIYRARLNGGRVALTAASSLRAPGSGTS